MKNFRDFAYLNVKKGILFRGSYLYHLSRKDRKLLFETNNIKTVIDLRSTQEHDDKKDAVPPGIAYYHLPLITLEEMGTTSEKEGKKKILREKKMPDIFDYYRKLVSRDRKESWTKIFEILLNNDRSGIYFHCTAGKDRTGIVAAVILTLLGIDKETIYKDYMLTNNDPAIPLSYRIFSLTFAREFRKTFLEYFKAKEEYLDEAFNEIDRVYGSIDNFYTECCSLDDEKIAKFKEKYLTK